MYEMQRKFKWNNAENIIVVYKPMKVFYKVPIYIVSYYINLVKTSWIYGASSMFQKRNKQYSTNYISI